MKEHKPDQHTVFGAVALANRAPSVHNTQPWRWLLGDESIHLMADQTRRLPATDPDGRDLLLSCGAALHHLRVSLAALGWRTVVHRLPNPRDPDHLAAIEFGPKTPSTEDITLVGAIYSDELAAWTGRGRLARDGVLTASVPPGEHTHGDTAMRTQILDGAATPHLILRTGWAPTAAPPPPQSPRRATADTFDYLPGTHPPRRR